MLHERAGISLSTVSVVLFVNGAAGLLGTTFAGSIVDRFPRKLAVIAPSALVSLFAALFLVGDQSMLTIALVTVWGLIGAMLPVALQTSLIKIAGDRADEASSLYVSGFNIGIGGGALIGGQLIAHIGLAGLPVFGGLLAIAGTIVIARGRHSFRPHAHHLPHSRSATDVDAPQLQPQR
jgi:predicted MFS family arabinose efflux permease